MPRFLFHMVAGLELMNLIFMLYSWISSMLICKKYFLNIIKMNHNEATEIAKELSNREKDKFRTSVQK